MHLLAYRAKYMEKCKPIYVGIPICRAKCLETCIFVHNIIIGRGKCMKNCILPVGRIPAKFQFPLHTNRIQAWVLKNDKLFTDCNFVIIIIWEFLEVLEEGLNRSRQTVRIYPH